MNGLLLGVYGRKGTGDDATSDFGIFKDDGGSVFKDDGGSTFVGLTSTPAPSTNKFKDDGDSTFKDDGGSTFKED